jgi:hypothetical protein
MITLAGMLLREYCKPVNHLELIKALAEERGIPFADIQSFINSGEYGIGQYNNTWLIRKSKLFTPTIAPGKRGITKADLLNAVSASEVFSNELQRPLKDAKWQVVNCVFHEDSKPSMGILLPEGGFHCLGCGERGGSVIDLAMKLHNLDFPESITYLADRYTTLRTQT